MIYVKNITFLPIFEKVTETSKFMIFKTIFSVFVMFRIFTSNCFSQAPDSLFNRAKFYYTNEEYTLAIPCLSTYINQNQGSYISFLLRGNCFLETGQFTKAIQDFLFALKIKKESELFYNLGVAYERAEMLDSAIYYYRSYIRIEPGRADGYKRVCMLYMYNYPEWGDSAVYYARKVVKIEPGNIANLNLLAMAYYSDNQYKTALETALIGLSIDSSYTLLNQTAGICSFLLREYPSAINYFERAYESNPSDFTLLDYKIQSMLMQNTSPDQIIFQSGKRISFKDISSENINKTEDRILDFKGKYAYNNLVLKIQSSPLNMSIDEFFMLYFGYSMQPGYTPYKKSSLEKHIKNDLISEAGILEETLNKNPTDFPLYLSLADIYLEIGNKEKYFENRFKYFGFAESIKASGTGLSFASAIIINDINHGYDIMLNLDYRIKSHSLIKEKKSYFNVITGTDQNNKEVKIFFNIDLPFGTLPKKLKKQELMPKQDEGKGRM